MKRTLIVMTLALTATAVLADDVIAQRIALMKANGKAALGIGKMLKGDTPFDLATVQAALKTYADMAKTAPTLFPDNSKTGGETAALPAIWTNKKDFEDRFAKIGADAAAAQAAVKDEASFKATVLPILKECNDCHKQYRSE